MKIYIRDGNVLFYKYRINGTDRLSRKISLYAKDDDDKTRQMAKMQDSYAVNIEPSTEAVLKAKEWQELNKFKNFDVAEAEEFIGIKN